MMLIENWKKRHTKIFLPEGAVLMDLSKTSDCILHDLLIAKLHGCGLNFDTVTF